MAGKDNGSEATTVFNLNDGKRELVDEARAKVLVETALAGREHASFTRICLSNKSYDEEAATVIAEVSENCLAVTLSSFTIVTETCSNLLALHCPGAV
jgi:hypothetical protein